MALPALRPREVLVALVGLSFGISAAWFGYYDSSIWGPLALGFLALALALVVVARRPLGPLAQVALAGLAGLWLWALLSRAWGESADQALTEANRWALYAAIFLVLVLLIRGSRRAGLIAVAVCALPILGVAVWTVVKLLGDSGPSLFLGNRLNDPVGYVNGQANYLLLAIWPLVALAERRRALIAGLAAGMATLIAAVIVLTESRGALLAAVVSAIVLVALVPGRRRRLWLILVVAGAVAAIGGPLLDVYRHTTGGLVRPSLVHHAAKLALLAAGASALLWGLGTWITGAAAAWRPAAARWLPRISSAPLIVVALAGAGVAVARQHRIRPELKRQYHAFVDLQIGAPGSARLFSGGGYRYDYWTVAWHEFKDEPLKGLGAGNYDRRYFIERRTSEDIRQPHSVEMQTLAELGLIGGALLLLFIGAVLTGLWRRARRAARDPLERAIAVTCGGTFLVWLVHTSVDWIHLLPGLTGIALCSAAVLVGKPDDGWTRSWRRGRRPFPVAIVLTGVAVAFAALMIGRMTLAQHYRTQARDALRSDPLRALSKTSDALAYNNQNVPTYYIRSAAFERLGLYERARETMLKAVRLERHDSVTWALFGDLALRHGDRARAQAYYRQAKRLNPRAGDPTAPAGTPAARRLPRAFSSR